MGKKEVVAGPGYDYFEDEPMGTEEIRTSTPGQLDENTFRQRTDPEHLLEVFKLQLMNAYKKRIIKKDKEGNIISEESKIKFKKNTSPTANKKGQEGIIGYLQRFVNNHTVQGHTLTPDEHRIRMRYVSNDLTVHFMTQRENWGVSIDMIDALISTSINIIDIFLTRTLYNKERESYNEGYKETHHKESKPEQKPNVFQRVGGLLGGKM